jgi:hypothetical protein
VENSAPSPSPKRFLPTAIRSAMKNRGFAKVSGV